MLAHGVVRQLLARVLPDATVTDDSAAAVFVDAQDALVALSTERSIILSLSLYFLDFIVPRVIWGFVSHCSVGEIPSHYHAQNYLHLRRR